MRLKGKKILVTGASRGIGAGIAKVLASEGATVAITYSSREDSAQKVLSELKENGHGEGHFCVKMDLKEEASILLAFEQVLEKFGELDGLVNNAGITKDQLMLRMKASDFDEVIQTNLRGSFLCVKAALKPMLKAKRGSIVNISSVIGHTGNAGQANYAASKGGLEAFSKSVALEIASRNIRVNCVAPGFIATEMTEILTEEQKNQILNKVPLNAMGDTSDVAHAVTFLLSSESKYITGQTIHVNGGLYM